MAWLSGKRVQWRFVRISTGKPVAEMHWVEAIGSDPWSGMPDLDDIETVYRIHPDDERGAWNPIKTAAVWVHSDKYVASTASIENFYKSLTDQEKQAARQAFLEISGAYFEFLFEGKQISDS